MDSHPSIQSIKNIPGKNKAHEVHAGATFIQLFNKVDLKVVMKGGRWSSEGTFIFFYLSDLPLQADSIRKTERLVATGEIMEISC